MASERNLKDYFVSTMAISKPDGVSGSIPSQVRDSAALFILLTSDKRRTKFRKMISRREPREIERIASHMMSNPDYFTSIIETKNGTSRVKKLFGISPEADGFFCAAILSRFVYIMTHRYTNQVVVRAMIFFDQEKKGALYHLTHDHLLAIASTEHGCVLLNGIITHLDDLHFKNLLFDAVANNALLLSTHLHGTCVVQHVLNFNDLRTTRNVLARLRGYFVHLSFTEHGSYVVEMLLEATHESTVAVVEELLGCHLDRLVSLATDEFGNFVVAKALIVTPETMHPAYLFSPLVHRLMPFRDFLRSSHGYAIAEILDSTAFFPF